MNTISKITNEVNKLSESLEELLQTKEKSHQFFQKQFDSINQKIDNIENSKERPALSTENKIFEDFLRGNKQMNSENNNKEALNFTTTNIPSNKSTSNLIYIDNQDLILSSKITSQIHDALQKTSVMRKLCEIYKISSDSLVYVNSNQENLGVEWTEKNTYLYPISKKNENINQSNNINITKINTNEMVSEIKVSPSMLEDGLINIESFLLNEATKSFAFSENTEFILGSEPHNKPYGILYQLPEKCYSTIDKEEDLSFEEILNLTLKLKEEYIDNAAFLVNRRFLFNLQKIKRNFGDIPLLQPGTNPGQPYTMFQIPVYTCSEELICKNEEGTNLKHLIVLADFKSTYKIVESSKISLLRDPYSNKPYVSLYFRKKIGGKRVNDSSIVTIATPAAETTPEPKASDIDTSEADE